jgi:hypothetical protein
MAGLDPAIHEEKGRPKGRPFSSAFLSSVRGSKKQIADGQKSKNDVLFQTKNRKKVGNSHASI